MFIESGTITVRAGANLRLRDTVYDGTPMDGAIHMQAEVRDKIKREMLKRNSNYLSAFQTR